jgi:hypothetical protein
MLTTIGGHLHNGGERMVMYLNDKEICVSKPTYEGETIAGMNDCTKPIKVKKGDALTMKSVYDITKHPMSVSVRRLHFKTNNLQEGQRTWRVVTGCSRWTRSHGDVHY